MMSTRNDLDLVALRPLADAPVDREVRCFRRLAHGISHAASPPVASLAAAFLAAGIDGSPQAFLAAGVFSLIGVVTPVLALIRQWRHGEVTDIEITHRDQRVWPMLLTATCVGGAAVILQLVGAPPAITGLASILGVQSLLLLLVTMSWKISVHCAAVATLGCLISLLTHRPEPLLLACLTMIWARLYLRRHTMLQTLAGSALGAALPAVLWPLLVG